MDNDFNVNNPTKDNIEYAFKNLLFYLFTSLHLDIYHKYNSMFSKIFDKINVIFGEYILRGNLKDIDENKLQDVKFDLIDVDDLTKNLKSYYAEWTLMWLDAIISLRMSDIKIGGTICECWK